MSTTDAILAQIDDALDDWSIGPDAMRCNAPPGNRGLMPRFPRIQPPTPEQIGALAVRVTAAFEPVKMAMENMARQVAALAAQPVFRQAFGLPPLHDRRHPEPLCIDGDAYARRRAARRRRR